jgi:hypothetical protein
LVWQLGGGASIDSLSQLAGEDLEQWGNANQQLMRDYPRSE